MKRSINFFLYNLLFICASIALPPLPQQIKDLCQQYPHTAAPFIQSLQELIKAKNSRSPLFSRLFQDFCGKVYVDFNEKMLHPFDAKAKALLYQTLILNGLPLSVNSHEETRMPTRLPPAPPIQQDHVQKSSFNPLSLISRPIIRQPSLPEPLPTPESLKKIALTIAEKFELADCLSFPDITFDHIIGGVQPEIKIAQRLLMGDPYFKAVGARKPAGTLLYGPPGTGKTLVVKALAGESSKQSLTPLIYIPGSSFVKKYVGMGAEKVRKIFELASALVERFSYSIIFIDEIDAIGVKREGNDDGGRQEIASTTTALMTCLDGQDTKTKEKVIVFAATNREHVLDEGLTRSKRFDHKIKIDLPEKKKREAIINYYLFKAIPRLMEKNINKDLVMQLAEESAGFNCADFDTLVNNAALTAGYERRKIDAQDLLNELEKIKESKPSEESTRPPELMFT